MPKITKDQVKKWSAQCFNGFEFDLYRFLTWGDKQAVHFIDLSEAHDDSVRLEATVYWRDVTERYRTVGHLPVLGLQIFRKSGTEGVMVSRGLGACIELSKEIFPRKVWKTLAGFTADWTDEKLLAMLQDGEVKAQLKKETLW